jgi:hypothetical protein
MEIFVSSFATFWAMVPAGVHQLIEVIGWSAILVLAVTCIIVFARAQVKASNARELAAEVLKNPIAAVQQIIDLEKKIAEEARKHASEYEPRARELERLKKSFGERFTWVSGLEDIRRHLEEKSSANR